MRRLAACALASFAIVAGAADTVAIDIRVRDIPARSLLHHVADVSRMAIVAGSEAPVERVSLEAQALGVREWIERFALERKLAVGWQGSIQLMASPCRLSHPAALPALPGDLAQITFQYQNSTAAHVATDAFAALVKPAAVSYPFDDRADALTAFARDVPTSNLIAAIATVMGWEVQRDKDHLTFTHRALDKPCEARVEAGLPFAPPPDCPPRISILPTKRKCEPLERFPVESLRPLGYIRVPTGQTFALIEATGTGLVYRLGKGNYLGPDSGLVTRVDDEGLEISEIVYDKGSDMYSERRRRLPFPP